MLGGHRVQPDGGVTVAHLGVHDGAVVEAVQAPRGEAEGPDEEVVGRLDVLVDEDRDDGVPGGGGGVAGEAHDAHSAAARSPVLDWAHARDPRGTDRSPGPARRLHGDGRPAPARHHLRRAPAERSAAHGAPAGDAPARAGHGDGRRAPAGRAGRRLLPARHVLVQLGPRRRPHAPPGGAAGVQRHPPPGRGARGDGARPGRAASPSTTPPSASSVRPCSTSTCPSRGRRSRNGSRAPTRVGARIVPEKIFTFHLAG